MNCNISDLRKSLPPLRYPVIIYGAGTVGRLLLQKIGKKKIVYFVDKYKKGKLCGVDVRNLDYLTEKYPIVIASIIWEREIYNNLKEMGYKPYPYSYLNYKYPRIFDYRDYKTLHKSLRDRTNMGKARSLWEDKESTNVYDAILEFRKKYYFNVQMDSIKSSDPQYFIPQLRLGREVFVDCGPYSLRGSTVLDFLKHARGKVYAFEMDRHNYLKVIKSVKGKNINIYNIGVYKRNGYFPAYINGGTESRLSNYDRLLFYPIKQETRKDMVQMAKLDDFLPEVPTFIKMDIEGSEYDALIGMKNIIKNNKPKLAICVYHKPTDLWEIPLFVKRLNLSYKLYLRHHSREVVDTVMYAI